MSNPKIGQKIYVPGQMYISRGSDDIAGGKATIDHITLEISGGKPCHFVGVKEVPGLKYRWENYLQEQQADLKKQYGKQVAHPDPDIDTPWIEPGDIVNGKVYEGAPQW